MAIRFFLLVSIVFAVASFAAEEAHAMVTDVPSPGVDYVVPLAEQGWTADPHVIWYDSFDEPGAAQRYMEFVTADGLMRQVLDEGLGGSGGSIRTVFERGTVSAGNLKLTFGDWPGGGHPKAAGRKFTEIHWRVYVKHQAGWTGNPAKLSRAIAMANTDWAEGAIAHVWGGPGDVLTLDPATGIDRNGRLVTTRYNDFPHLRWLGNSPTGSVPIFATALSGRWMAVEAAVRLNTPGKADGTFKLWIDGKLDAVRTGLNWHDTWTEKGINAIFLENYWNDGSPARQSRSFDDFVVSTRPIGLARTGLNPEIVKIPYALTTTGGRQSAWQAQVATTTAEPVLVWDSGTIAGSGDRVRVDADHGRFAGNSTGDSALKPGQRYAVRVRQRDQDGAWSAWSTWRSLIQTASDQEAPE